MGDGTPLVRGRGRLSPEELALYAPALRTLRELGATAIKLGVDGDLVIAFDGALMPTEPEAPAAPAAPVDDEDALFDSVDAE